MLQQVKQHDLANLMLNEYDYNEWFRKELDDLTLKGDKKRFR